MKAVTDLLFIDLATKPLPNFDEADYLSYHPNDTELKALPYYAEYGEVDYVTLAYLKVENEEVIINCKMLQGETEKDTLLLLAGSLSRTSSMKITGWQLSTYVIPFLNKRYLINELQIPKSLYFEDLKPWSQEILDVSIMWRSSSLLYPDLEEVHRVLNTNGIITTAESGELIDYQYTDIIKSAEILLRSVHPKLYISKAII